MIHIRLFLVVAAVSCALESISFSTSLYAVVFEKYATEFMPLPQLIYFQSPIFWCLPFIGLIGFSILLAWDYWDNIGSWILLPIILLFVSQGFDVGWDLFICLEMRPDIFLLYYVYLLGLNAAMLVVTYRRRP